MVPLPMMIWTSLYTPYPPDARHGFTYLFPQASDMEPTPLLVTPGGDHLRSIQIWSLEDLLPVVLKSSGCHQNTYVWQVGGTYPTGMLSCWELQLVCDIFCQLDPTFCARWHKRSRCISLLYK